METATPAENPVDDPEFARPDFNSAQFDNPTQIDNKYFPLVPGTQLVYEGITDEGGRQIPHSIIYNVTDLTKKILDTYTVVVWILDYSDGQLVEAEIAFYAQDNDGNVWFLGEYPEVYENGEVVEAPAWIPGFKNAEAGIVMKAEPQLDQPSYAQGWGPAVSWTDRARVVGLGEQTCVPVKCYEDVLITEEFSQSEPNAFQVKYYVPGIGNVRVGWRGDDASQEELELVELNRLNPEQMADTRAQALELEKRAYAISKEVYDQTPVSEYPMGTPAMTVDPSTLPPVSLPTAPVVSSGSPSEVIVYASDLPEDTLFELALMEDSNSPGGLFIGLPNNGDELDPPPENDPHVNFQVQVKSGIPYRCWVHMKVGEPKGRSNANVVWVQVSNAVDKSGGGMFEPESSSYLTAQGPLQSGWVWVGCNLEGSDTLIFFAANGEVTVRLQAGAEGVGFDQFILSALEYMEHPPSEPIVEK